MRRGRRSLSGAGRAAEPERSGRPAGGFALVELLVVVAILALLASLLLPGLRHARVAARIVRAHAELRQVDVALQMYLDANRDHLPPTRSSCSLRQDFELPVELGVQRMLPYETATVRTGYGEAQVDRVTMPDVFAPHLTYKYRAPGPAIINDTLSEPPFGASLWVPHAFPDVSSAEGRYYTNARDEPPSPVRYAIWSIGPDPDSPKFRSTAVRIGKAPVPRFFWCRGATDTGMVTHFMDRAGRLYQSP